jgi:alginate O-acetyltransferase complex protein AlgI
MLFLTYWFFLYACVFFPLYWIFPSHSIRRLLLVAGSVTFHTHFAGPAGVAPIVVMGICTYLSALSGHRGVCRSMILVNVLALVYYKYTIFLSTKVVGAIWPSSDQLIAYPFLREIVPPLAISFFVFEYVHYLLDILGGSAPIRDPLDFILFSVFWPSIVAGPVKRYQEFVPELHRGLLEVESADVAEGVLRVAIGFAKKFIADNLTAYISYCDPLYGSMPILDRWEVVLFIGIRILMDFSGYTDMAVGFARMQGIRLPENFNWPYLARSINEFWRRWHMSLSRWIRDYVSPWEAIAAGLCERPSTGSSLSLSVGSGTVRGLTSWCGDFITGQVWRLPGVIAEWAGRDGCWGSCSTQHLCSAGARRCSSCSLAGSFSSIPCRRRYK